MSTDLTLCFLILNRGLKQFTLFELKKIIVLRISMLYVFFYYVYSLLYLSEEHRCASRTPMHDVEMVSSVGRGAIPGYKRPQPNQ